MKHLIGILTPTDTWKLLHFLSRQGKTIIVSMHDLVAARRFCDDVIVLNQGSCAAKGLYQDVISPKLIELVFGLTQADQTQL
jgi:ABC-type cobalamin/Fe3+-siderophores transport system ATPase subunit